MKISQMIVALVNADLISDKELRGLIITALHLFNSNKHLFAIEKALKEICDYERVEP